MKSEMEFHELANVFPLLAGAEFDELVSSIKRNGQLERIITWQGKILDGRNRYRACIAAGVEPYSEEFEGTLEEAREFVVDANIRRRHLSASQRALAATKLANLAIGGNGSNQHGSKPANLPHCSDEAPTAAAVTQAQAATMLNVSERSVRAARHVLDDGAPELVGAVERGKISVSAAATVASLPKHEQAEIVAGGRGEVVAAARTVRAEAVACRDNAPPPLDPDYGDGPIDQPEATREPVAVNSRPTAAAMTAKPLRSLENISGGELARWIKITTPKDHPHVVRVLEMAAAILRDEMRGSAA